MTHDIHIYDMSQYRYDGIAKQVPDETPLWDYPVSELTDLMEGDHCENYALLYDDHGEPRLHELPDNWQELSENVPFNVGG